MGISLKGQCKRVQSLSYPLLEKKNVIFTALHVTKTGHAVGSKFTCVVTCFWQEGGVSNSPTRHMKHSASIHSFIY